MADRKPFETINERARWEDCYDLALSRQPREQITLHEVMEMLGCDEPAAWASMREAVARLERNGHRSLITEPKFGWIVATASDMLRLVDKREKKTVRALGRAARGLRATPRGELSQFERQAMDWQGRARHGTRLGGRHTPGFESRASTLCKAQPGWAWLCLARRGVWLRGWSQGGFDSHPRTHGVVRQG